MKKLALLLIGVLVLAWMTLAGIDGWIYSHRIQAGPTNETLLYQTYDPEPVIQRFRDPGQYHGDGHGEGSLHLIKSIQHWQDFTPGFTMQTNLEQQLLDALHQDILLRLRATGTHMVSTRNEPNGGFTYQYTSGHSIGSISVQPPGHRLVVRRYSLPKGLDDVGVKIVLKETWTRPPSETTWWMAAFD